MPCRRLDALGHDGWEAVGFSPSNASSHGLHVETTQYRRVVEALPAVRVSPRPLVVGVPREVKTDEHRVAITPDGVLEMTHRDVRVVIESGAGSDSGIADDDYRGAGAEIVAERRCRVGTLRSRTQGEGTPARRVPPPASGPRAVHLPAPRGLPAGRARAARRRRRSRSATRPCNSPTVTFRSWCR